MTALGSTVRRDWQPVVTYSLIAVNVIAFAFSAKQSGSIDNNMASYEVARLALSEPATANGWWWTAVTSGFLHFGPFHLLVNMFTLYVFGRNVEQALGRARFGAIYALSLLGGSAAVLWFGLENTITVGASGAIFGLIGAELVLFLKLKLNPTSLLVLIGVNVVASFTFSAISWLGHLGGFVIGAAVTAGFVYGPELLPRDKRTRQQVEGIGWACAGVIAAVVVAAIAVRFGTFPGAQVYSLR
ncbi:MULTISPECIES: rhomboid family intramembrane serine protease [Tsukamurella]|uniref:Rhomboid family intramembrane serine protease n=2 Tax=Tsukamurella TaxID=2060 RepID=A0A5C5RYJ5_9ACTN|nr:MULTISPECIES: rhomboid family intramembrane serine protease [Tsukamurella]NMD57359.1 rhomboid family intramembrane serine protease [Tsukamurella columbiensis]TWS27742.1 rhomboid family intramembrane serine protease [Tsukamurella conjunctivitidis]